MIRLSYLHYSKVIKLIKKLKKQWWRKNINAGYNKVFSVTLGGQTMMLIEIVQQAIKFLSHIPIPIPKFHTKYPYLDTILITIHKKNRIKQKILFLHYINQTHKHVDTVNNF